MTEEAESVDMNPKDTSFPTPLNHEHSCPLQLRGKRGLIFGVANQRSIAWACAEQMIKYGAELFISVLDERSAKRASKLLSSVSTPSDPPTHLIRECDVRSSEDIARLAREVAERWGQLDFIIHSVAFAHLEDLKQPVSACRREGYLDAMEISAFSLLSIVNEFKPLLSEIGSIVTMTYIGSEIAIPSYGIMGPVKAALEAQVRYLASELGPDGVRVNAVSAGPLKTLAASAIPGFRKHLKESGERTPLGRNISHLEVANTTAFLCSQMSSGICGEVIHVDAGQHAVREM